MHFLLRFLIYWMLVYNTVEVNSDCDVHCNCHQPYYRKNYKLVCSGNMLTYVPKIPYYISQLWVKNANLTYIGESGLRNLSSRIITKLVFSGNCIKFIHHKAFMLLPHLKSLTFENETFLNSDVLANSLQNLNMTKLYQFKLIYNTWKHIPNDIFENTNITELTITGNELPLVNWAVFKYLKHCYKLILSSNKIEDMVLTEMPRLKRLNLEDNRLSAIPNFCKTVNTSYVPLLTHLILNKNTIYQIKKENFKCLTRLSSLKLGGNIIRSLVSNVFIFLRSLNTLMLNELISLKHIGDFAFNITNLKRLHIGNTKFRFSRENRFNPKTIFKLCSNLSYLSMGGNHFHGRYDILRIMLLQIPQLEYLNLYSNGLRGLPDNTFMFLPRLRKLILNRNRIHELGENVFRNVTSLKSLHLSTNLFGHISKTFFPEELLTSLEEIDISKNPFSCDCNLKWFLNWIQTTNLTVLQYPQFYICRTPTVLTGTSLEQYHPTQAICNPWNQLFTLAIVLSSFLSLAVLVLFIVYKCLNNIKNYTYLVRVQYSQRHQNVRFENQTEYEFDAFVVYCGSDEIWVHSIFLQKMEYEEGLRLCIHQRDFDAGETITRNIDKYLQRCRKVIVIMSNNFAKSEWCQWEIDVVQERRRRQGKDVFLLIMLQNIDSKHMTSELRTLLDSTPHLLHQTGLGETLFWEAAVKTLRKPIGYPPIAVL